MENNHRPISLEFTEQMSGHIGAGQNNFATGEAAGKEAGTRMKFELTIETSDVDRFIEDSDHVASARGFIWCDLFGGKCPVKTATFNLFNSSRGDRNRRTMLYRLFFHDAGGRPLTLSGHKDVHDDVGMDSWKDTTTLFVYILAGHIESATEPNAEIVAAGILHLTLADFLKQLTTFRTHGPSREKRLAGLLKFGRFFLGNLWDVYGPGAFLPELNEYEREIPLYTTEGVRNAHITIHPFSTVDKIGLSLTRFQQAECKDVVMIIHGLTTSTDMFIMPEHYNLVSYLHDHGFKDVWTLDYRMSNRFTYNMHRHRYTMDDIALFDYPPALATIRQHAGENVRIHIICHCLGAVSFTMSLFAKAVTGIRSVVANSAALTPCVPSWSRIKIAVAPFLAEYILQLPYFNPRWSQEPGITISKIFTRITSLFHRECDVPGCHSWPALYNHKNLAEVTHRRGGDLYGPTSFHYYRHVRKMVESNNTAVKFDPNNPKHRSLPDNYFQYAKEIETPILFMTGAENRVFANSNIECHRRLEALVPGRHSLRVIPGYGHQDVFMGNKVDRDVFPFIVDHLNKHRQ